MPSPLSRLQIRTKFTLLLLVLGLLPPAGVTPIVFSNPEDMEQNRLADMEGKVAAVNSIDSNGKEIDSSKLAAPVYDYSDRMIGVRANFAVFGAIENIVKHIYNQKKASGEQKIVFAIAAA